MITERMECEYCIHRCFSNFCRLQGKTISLTLRQHRKKCQELNDWTLRKIQIEVKGE